MKKHQIICVAFLCLFVYSCNQHVSKKGLKHLEPKEFYAFVTLDTIQIVDVRTSKEFRNGHIPNATNINFFSNDFVSKIKELDSIKPVYIYCRSGKRSNKSIEHFQKVGFSQIYNLKGGYLSWKEEGLPISIQN